MISLIKRYKGIREYNKLQKLKQDIINAKKRRTYALLKEIRQAFNNKQAVINIKRQLLGGVVDEDVKKILVTEKGILFKQIYLLKKLMTWPTSLSIKAKWRRRSEAINAVTAYYHVKKGGF